MKQVSKIKLIIQLLVSHSLSLCYAWFVVGFSYIPDSAYSGGKVGSQYWLSLGIIQFQYSLGGLEIKMFGTKKPFLSYLKIEFNNGVWLVNRKEKNGGTAYGGTPRPLPFMRKRAKLSHPHIN